MSTNQPESHGMPDASISCVQTFATARVLVVGDVMIDRFIEGSVKRISPESPVPVFNAGRHELIPGGAANVAQNVAALGGRCTLVGVVGADDAATALKDAIRARSDITVEFITCQDRPTTEKTRYVTQGHHMLRVDNEVSLPIAAGAESDIVARVDRLLDSHDVLVLSDYAKGVLTPGVVRKVIDAAKAAGRPIVVDPKTADLGRYAGATVLTPNAHEMHLASGIDPSSDTEAEAAARRGLERTDVDAILVTRSEKGMTLVPRLGPTTHIPTTGREVYDVVGAGDTVIATLATAMACGAALATAARIANAAAGIVVGKRGTASVSQAELIAELEAQLHSRPRRGAPVMLTPDDAARYARACKAAGKQVGFTNGVFDILHPGHIAILHAARDACDCLIVGLNSDASVKRLKGPTRPINTQSDRAIVLGALGTVDAVVIFDTDTPLELIRAIQPDVLVKGADYTVATVVGADLVIAYGGTVLLAELVPGVSSTNTIAKARMGEFK